MDTITRLESALNTNNNDNFDAFCFKLWEFAHKQIPMVQAKIAANARDLYGDATLRKMINTYAKLSSDVDFDAKSAFIAMCNGDEPDFIDVWKLDAYASVLKDVIYDRLEI